jgi:ABC-type multidrug transport system ATPase subunit
MNDFAVTAENLTKKFDSFTAVDKVNFSVKKGVQKESLFLIKRIH